MSAVLLLCLTTLADPETIAAGHHGRFDAAAIHWRSVLIRHGPLPRRVVLARPLPREVELVPGEPISLERDAQGRVVAIQLPLALARDAPLSLELSQPIRSGEVELSPPIPEGGGVQRVSLEGSGHFVPREDLGLQSHLRGWVEPSADHDSRERLDRELDALAPDPGPKPIYLSAGSAIAARGLRGTLAPPGVSVSVAIAVGGLFLLLLGALAAIYPRLARRASVERAEAAMHAEFAGLVDRQSGDGSRAGD